MKLFIWKNSQFCIILTNWFRHPINLACFTSGIGL
jgi:hypothetical protein